MKGDTKSFHCSSTSLRRSPKSEFLLCATLSRSPHVSYGLNLGWGDLYKNVYGFGGDRLRDILQISSRAHMGRS